MRSTSSGLKPLRLLTSLHNAKIQKKINIIFTAMNFSNIALKYVMWPRNAVALVKPSMRYEFFTTVSVIMLFFRD
jgi:hypothetical protein